MADSIYLLAKVAHVVLASLWVGGGFLNVFLVQRLLAASSDATRSDFGPRFFMAAMKYFNAVGGLTIVSGFLVLYLHPNGFANLTGSMWGKLVLVGVLCAFFVLYLLNFAVRPTMKAITKVQAKARPDLPPSANVRFLLARVRITSILNVALLLLAMGAMVAANVLYFGP